MKVLVVNGSLKEDNHIANVNKVIEYIFIEKGYEVESILIHGKEISECLGCFSCWIKTPGICVIDDYGRILTGKIINSDLVIYLTPVVYGGYSSDIKKAIDRRIPLGLPFLRKVNGEVHHKQRYERYPEIIVLGMMSDEDKDMSDIFNSLIERNSKNWHDSLSGGTIQNGSEEYIKYQLNHLLKNVEVEYVK